MDERFVPEYEVDLIYQGIEQETQKFVLENQLKEASEIELQNKYKNAEKELSEMKITVEKLQKENSILKRNISCIFRTAQQEIKRKDDEISKLRDKYSKSNE